MRALPYDALATIYDCWIQGDPARKACHDFYVRWATSQAGGVVEIGVGTGEIAIRIAHGGCNVVGIDVSEPMLRLCSTKVIREGVAHRVALCRMNAMQLGLCNVERIILPFRTVGHFTEREQRLELFKQIRGSLRPGGLFVFDHYVLDREWAAEIAGKQTLMFESTAEDERLRILDSYEFDFGRGIMDCSVQIESSRHSNKTIREVNFEFAWVEPVEIRRQVLAAGFEVVEVYGNFDRAEFASTSEQQIWVLRRPEQARSRI